MRTMALTLTLCLVSWVKPFATAEVAKLSDNPTPRAPTFPFDPAAARRYQQQYAASAGLPVEIRNDLGMTFVLIPPGSFAMGSPTSEVGRATGGVNEGFDETSHSVTLTQPFYLSRHETTIGQFRRFVDATSYVTDGERNGGGHAHDERADWKHRPGTSWRRPGYAAPFTLQDEHPVVHVSHADSREFCQWLGHHSPLKLTRPMKYCLPTESQWEWACRAGSVSRFWWGPDEDSSGKVANVGDRSLKLAHPNWPRSIMEMNDGHAFLAPVGSYQANAFGLHDMLGNVWEFCSTHSGPYPRQASTDPHDLDPARGFAVRGGGWSNTASDVRSATRNADPPHFCHSNLGFRVALVPAVAKEPNETEVLAGLRQFYGQTARSDGSFQPGIDPDYRGMSDSAYSDLAAVTYAVVIHKTFGWELPHEAKTVEFLLSRQEENGSFFNVAGTVDRNSAEGRVYNTTQALVALRALGVKPRFDPLPVFEDILRKDYKTLPPFSTSFFPLAYLCAGKPIPPQADRGIRALMVQDETGYLNDHIAATFHASHYYRLVGEETPKSKEMVARILRDQKLDGSWLLNLPSRDRHATFDAVFTLVQEGQGSADCRASIARAARWALACRNPDGGFGHLPGSTSDADAAYFQAGTLVMAGLVKPVAPLPKDAHLLSWGHLMSPPERNAGAAQFSVKLPGWIAAVAFSADGSRLATAGADKSARIHDAKTGRELVVLHGHGDVVSSVCFSRKGKQLATASYDHSAAIWDAESGRKVRQLVGHRGVVMSVAFSPDDKTLATASVDGTIRLWDSSTGALKATLAGHKSWVNAIAYSPDGKWLASGSSDGTIIIWSCEARTAQKTLQVTSAEVRCIAISADGKHLAAGTRYGTIKTWTTADWSEHLNFQGHDADVWTVAFSPDGASLASGNGDWNRGGHIKLWLVADGKQLTSFQHTGEVLSVAFSPDGKSLVAGAADTSLKLWHVTR